MMERLTERLNQSLNIDDADTEEKYNRYRQQGKEAAQRGELELSLRLFRKAFHLRPSDKLQTRIQKLEEAIQELNASEEEEEEFVDVQGSGLMLYKGLHDQLYKHQKDGVAFLFSLFKNKKDGGILADDMGLGKTVQVISFLSAMYDAELVKHTLLVMPTSLIKNWLSEFKRWTPGLRVKEFHGSSKTERTRNLERIQRGGGAIITTYQMIINNWQQLASHNQHEFMWDYIILDEAHKIKSSSTKTTKCVTAVPAKHRLLLTGTPVQNNLREMWALFDFACHGALLGSAKTFKTEYENPITRAREKDATPGEKALGLKIAQDLMKLIKPYFLRRTKAEVQNRKQKNADLNPEHEIQERKEGLEVPSLTHKTDLIVWTFLSKTQENIYRQFISLDHIKELLTTTRSPLAELTVLKKLCDHPRLLSVRALTQLGLREGSSDFQEDDAQTMESCIDGVADETLISESGKLEFLLRLMECLRKEGKRTLIFSQSRKMLDIIERVLTNRRFRLLRVDGTITQLTERERRIALFQTDTTYSIFLLTTQVGGVGLTLTAANRVVIFDPSWNPATDAQAVDRAYRIGQTNDVIIYRLITCGSIEEKIYRRQVFKDSLIRQTTGDKKNPFRYFTKQELKELFSLEDTRSSSTQLQLQSLHASIYCPDSEVEHHISTLQDMKVFGVSRHDLLFSNEEVEEEVHADEEHYIHQRVQKAQELVRAESQLHRQLVDNVNQNTEPAWMRLSRPPELPVHQPNRKPASPHSPPVVVDLTQSVSDDLEMLSTDAGLGLDRSVLDVSNFENPASPSANQPTLIIDDKSDHSNLDLSSAIIENGSDFRIYQEGSAVPDALKESGSQSSVVPEFESSESLMRSFSESQHHVGGSLDSEVDQKTNMDLSKPGLKEEPEALVGGELFKGNFNLQLEDSAQLLSDEKDEEEEEEHLEEEEFGAEEGDFQLQMDFTGEKTENSRHDNGIFSPGLQSSVLSSADDSNLIMSRKKKKTQVIYDSEEDEDEEVHPEEKVEKPVLASSPLSAKEHLCSSTPKSTMNCSVTQRRSINTSIASRRSLVESLLQDMEDEETDDDDYDDDDDDDDEEEEEHSNSNGVEQSQASDVSGKHVDESIMEEAEPSGETLDSECADESEVEEEEEEACEEEEAKEEEELSFINDSTEVELSSGEKMDQCAPSERCLLKPTSSITEVKEPEPRDETFASLVFRGKHSLAKGKKEEALELFLKAIDLNAGDSEIQLLIIQLYRQLSELRP